jgi:hypothetical protein
MIDKQSFAIHLAMTSTHSLTLWNLVVVYGPCRQPARDQFVNWFCNLQIQDEDLWLLVGDFNFYRYAENKNKAGVNFHDTLVFNNIISHLGLVELPIKWRSYTWSNMQEVPLCNRLIGFSHQLHGLPFSLSLLSCPLLGSLLITCLAECKLVLMSLKQISFILRTTGLTTLDVLNILKVLGSPVPTPTIVPTLSVQNLRTFVESLNIGLKAFQTFLSSFPTAI